MHRGQDHRRQPRHLGHRHQGNRREVEDEAGEAHAAEQGRPDREQHRLGAQSRREQGGRGRPPHRRGLAPAVERGGHAGRPQHDAEGGPERQQEARVEDREGRDRHDAGGGDREHVEGRRPVVDEPGPEDDHRGGGGPRHRRLVADDGAVAHHAGHHRREPGPRPEARQAREEQQAAGEDGDVAAGDGDDVVDAAVPQAPGGLGIELVPVADEDRGHHRRRLVPVAPHRAGDGAPDEVPRRGGQLDPPRRVPHHVDEEAALHRPAQGRPPQRLPPRLVAGPRIVERGDRPQGGGQPHVAPLPPGRKPVRPALAAHRQAHPAGHRHRSVPPADARHRQLESGPVVGDRGVAQQPPLEPHRPDPARPSRLGMPVEPLLQRRLQGRRAVRRGQRRPPEGEADPQQHGHAGRRRAARDGHQGQDPDRRQGRPQAGRRQGQPHPRRRSDQQRHGRHRRGHPHAACSCKNRVAERRRPAHRERRRTHPRGSGRERPRRPSEDRPTRPGGPAPPCRICAASGRAASRCLPPPATGVPFNPSRIRRILSNLDSAIRPRDMDLPGYRIRGRVTAAGMERSGLRPLAHRLSVHGRRGG